MWYLTFIAISNFTPTMILDPLPTFDTKEACVQRLAEELKKGKEISDELGIPIRMIGKCVQAEQEKEMLLG